MQTTTKRFHGLSAYNPAQLLEAVLEANAKYQRGFVFGGGLVDRAADDEETGG